MGRVEVVAAIALLAGLPGILLSARRLIRAIRFRMEPGRPYLAGSIRRCAFALLLCLVAAAAGAGLAGICWLTRGFQRVRGTAAVGQVRVTGPSAGPLLLEFAPAPGMRQPTLTVAGLDGREWRVSGKLVAFPGWLAPLGLECAHYLEQIGDPGRESRRSPPGVARAMSWFSRSPPAVGLAPRSVSLAATGALPEWTSLRIRCDGYLLGTPAGSVASGGGAR